VIARRITCLFVFLVMLGGPVCHAQTPSKLTDLFSADEAQKAGISKLNSDELAALNAAFFRVLMQLTSGSGTRTGVGLNWSDSDDLDFYDSRGRAVAYLAADRDLTIYLWSGEPVAYLEEDSVFGFNGKHLGWLKDGAISDHDGHILAATAKRFKVPVAPAPPKSFKQFKPFKSFKEFKPFKPFFNLSWSELPARVFFLGGVD